MIRPATWSSAAPEGVPRRRSTRRASAGTATIGSLVARLALTCVAAAGLVVAASGSAQAAEPVMTSPAAGANLRGSPGYVQLTFDRMVDPAKSSVAVSGPGGNAAAGPSRVMGRSVFLPLASGLPAGQYSVSWHVRLWRGGRSSGSYSFGIRLAPKPTSTPTHSQTATRTPTPTATTPSAPPPTTAAAAPLVPPTTAAPSTGAQPAQSQPGNDSGSGLGLGVLLVWMLAVTVPTSGALLGWWWWRRRQDSRGVPVGRRQPSRVAPARPRAGPQDTTEEIEVPPLLRHQP